MGSEWHRPDFRVHEPSFGSADYNDRGRTLDVRWYDERSYQSRITHRNAACSVRKKALSQQPVIYRFIVDNEVKAECGGPRRVEMRQWLNIFGRIQRFWHRRPDEAHRIDA